MISNGRITDEAFEAIQGQGMAKITALPKSFYETDKSKYMAIDWDRIKLEKYNESKYDDYSDWWKDPWKESLKDPWGEFKFPIS